MVNFTLVMVDVTIIIGVLIQSFIQQIMTGVSRFNCSREKVNSICFLVHQFSVLICL